MQLTTDLLRHAYRQGIFPMAETRDSPSVIFVDPDWRGLFLPQDFHLSRSTQALMRRSGFGLSFDSAFAKVMEACADRSETWINGEILAVYQAAHREGFAHSVEIWSPDGVLVGGVYGVAFGAAFFGESMFSRTNGGSKLALAALMRHLTQRGFAFCDTQFLTPHLASLGAIELPKPRFKAMLRVAVDQKVSFLPLPFQGVAGLSGWMQDKTQTS